MDAIGSGLAPLLTTAMPSTYIFAVVVIAAELLFLIVARKSISPSGTFFSLFSGAVAFGALFITNRLFYAGLYSWAWTHRWATIEPAWWSWLGAFVLYDFLFYLSHRAGHSIRLLWCFHGVHHSAEEMNLATAVRASWLDFVYLPWFFAWIPILGIHPSMLLIIESFARMWGIVTHLNPHLVGRLGLLDRVIVTPSVHRVHHGRQVEYLDRNFGEVLLVWDHVFGTYQSEDVEPEYGLLRPRADHRLRTLQFGFFAELIRDIWRAPDWSTRLSYLLKAPGFRHDGPDERVVALVEKLYPEKQEPAPLPALLPRETTKEPVEPTILSA